MSDLIRLYSYWRSSAAFRVRIALNLKGLAYDYLAVNLVEGGGQQHASAFHKLNPQELVPVLVDGERVIRQSMSIIEYLAEVYHGAGVALLPPTARERARVRSIAQAVACDIHPLNNTRVLGYLGVHRSPVRTVEQATALARAIVARPGFELVGIMAYESQVAGVVNRPKGKPLLARTVDYVQKNSTAELRERRGAVVDAVRQIADLEFVNGGGTGSLERTAADPSVTEIAAGSGLFGPHLFDDYSHFSPAPAASFALTVVRKPKPTMATLLGGGWIASGPPAADRSPQLAWPEGLEYVRREGAGEVQSPVTGSAAAALTVGDRVWLRHTKAGELSEHLDEFVLVEGGRIVGTVPTYRGEGKAFL